MEPAVRGVPSAEPGSLRRPPMALLLGMPNAVPALLPLRRVPIDESESLMRLHLKEINVGQPPVSSKRLLTFMTLSAAAFTASFVGAASSTCSRQHPASSSAI